VNKGKLAVTRRFVLSLIGLVIIVASILYYNRMMTLSAALDDANQTIESVYAAQGGSAVGTGTGVERP
jgi:hypothetical protein